MTGPKHNNGCLDYCTEQIQCVNCNNESEPQIFDTIRGRRALYCIIPRTEQTIKCPCPTAM